MKLAELKDKKIRWDMTPQSYHAGIDGVEIRSQEDMQRIESLIRERAGMYFYIDVWDCQPRFAISINDKETGSSESKMIEQDIISEQEMIETIEQVGGMINRSGWYPINEKIKRKLEDFLNKSNEE